MKSERGALILSVVMSLVVGAAAVTAASLTQSKAILLDGLFNLIYFLVALVTVRISVLAAQPDDRKFPFGYGYFESLVNAGKGLLILGVALFALVDAVLALLAGGREIVAGPAIGYAVFATLACSLTAWALHRSRRHVDSPLMRADFENWLVNALISSGVLLTFCMIPVARFFDRDDIVPYVDSVLVIAVVLFCLSVPIRMAKGQCQVRMVRPGRQLYVMIHVVLPADFPLTGLPQLDTLRERLTSAVSAVYPHQVTDTLFTADAKWAEPCEAMPVVSTPRR